MVINTKKGRTYRVEIVGFLLYIMISVIGVTFILRWVNNFAYVSISNTATDIAKLVSASIDINDEQLDELIAIDFDELLDNEVNMQIEELVEEADLINNIKYVYVIRKLEDDEIRYTIDEEMSEFFGLDVGTELDYVWLMDYIADDEERAKAYADPEYYNDIYRYTHPSNELIRLSDEQKSDVLLSDNEWGNQISAYVPIYTTQGTYIGLLGVDIFANEYYDFTTNINSLTSIILMIVIVLIVSLFIYSYNNIKNEVKKDELSGLYTRTYYEKYANNLLKNKTDYLTIVMLDIDEFKLYNDYYGHVKGDTVLAAVSKVIATESITYKGCVGRFGGEEFIIIVPNISEKLGDKLCETIRKNVEKLHIPHENGRANKFVTVSAGIYTVDNTDNDCTLQELINLADKGLYKAKDNGRNRFVRYYNEDRI